MTSLTLRKWLLSNLGMILLLLCVLLGASLVGEQTLPLWRGWSALSEDQQTIFLVSRLPRVLLAAVAGMALGSSGTAFQGLLQNSLADPYILGVSSGAALGSILGLAIGLPFELIPILAFATAVAAMLTVYRLASSRGQLAPHTLLLVGVILNAFLFAFILILNGLVSFEQSQKILYLLIGSLETETFGRIALVFALVLIGIIFLSLEGHPLNLMTTGSDTAQSLGIDLLRHRRRIFFAACLMIGAVVPLAGLIGFVGLFVPHIARMLFGPDHRLSIPISGLIGAILLVLCDTVARTILVTSRYQTELPVGAITALIGAPFFLILLRKRSLR